jgi:hypothetical protein
VRRDEIIEEAAREGRDGRTRKVLLALGVLLVLLFALLGWAGWYIYQFKQAQVDAGAKINSMVTSACESGQLPKTDRLCTTAKEVEKVVTEGPPGPIGPIGPAGPGPTQAQVNQAVATWCSGGRCVGKPTASQVLAAVATICPGNQCDGKPGQPGDDGSPGVPGEDGSPGANGQNGTNGTDGTDGQNATPEQIATAVAEYCANDNCKGEKGENAYPFTFRFVVPARNPVESDRTYSCPVNDPSTTTVCTEVTEEQP